VWCGVAPCGVRRGRAMRMRAHLGSELEGAYDQCAGPFPSLAHDPALHLVLQYPAVVTDPSHEPLKLICPYMGMD